ncbi:MAG: DNA mismatch repair protein MutS [Clostridiales bacterium]|jgi:DNA mismatch repair protein MutS|nr:DNA mismatch repair protein MutS [Clostridiales bacterium]
MLTPMMKQYTDIKNKYKNELLFYRLGDFYELFFEDALIASKELNITLTSRDCGLEQKAPMCGVPYHAADNYIAKLIKKGFKVAICEQTEDPKLTKSIVKREVIRVVTQGTIIDTNILDDKSNNYIMCIYEDKKGFGIAVADVLTGEFLTNSIDGSRVILDEISKYAPSEIIVNDGFSFSNIIEKTFNLKPSLCPIWSFEQDTAYLKLNSHFKVHNLEGFGIEKNSHMVSASGALLEYLYDTQKNSLSHIITIRSLTNSDFMNLDAGSRRNLELSESIRDKTKKGSLLWVLDKTSTSMGARRLKMVINQPLTNKKQIDDRLDSVEELKTEVLLREEIKEILNTVYDIDRIIGKCIYQTANARDLIALKKSLSNLPSLKILLSNCKSNLLKLLFSKLDTLKGVYSLLNKSIIEEPPVSVRDGGIIKPQYNEELDSLRGIKNNANNVLLEYEEKERNLTNIKNLKIRYNKIFGYCLEVTNSYKGSAPDRYIRRQTLANCERYVTEELKEIEDTILGADEKILTLEFSLFQDILKEIGSKAEIIQRSSRVIAYLDVLVSLAEVADKYNYCKPAINTNGLINIKEGRHPVVERLIDTAFIPNDTYLNQDADILSIITGPNMAGKSTYMRQAALIVLMAQAGSFVPADFADISIVDRIFTRVGASDDLATGQSTFMVEMVEVANILNNATANSLLILDEIGRGTSTFDGLSIAWSVLEHIADTKKIGAKTLFATHYHELTELEGKVNGVKNYRITVMEQGEDIVFLRKIERGGAEYSYGVHVAKLAGIPKEVIIRADDILDRLNQADVAKHSITSPEEIVYKKSKKNSKQKNIINEIINIDIDALSPRDALKALYELQAKSKELAD